MSDVNDLFDLGRLVYIFFIFMHTFWKYCSIVNTLESFNAFSSDNLTNVVFNVSQTVRCTGWDTSTKHGRNDVASC